MHQKESKTCLKDEKVCQDRISELPDDLLIHILSQAPTKDAVTTMVLSKRWRFLWTMMRKLDYTDNCKGYIEKRSIWDFLDKSLQFHKAPLLESLRIKLVQPCPVYQDVGKWVLDAVKRCIRELKLDLDKYRLSYRPQILPDWLYTCKTLVSLSLSGNILVHVPTPACLPSLQTLKLKSVVYKDQDSHVRLLSSCPLLKDLVVVRHVDDNMTSFGVRVSSLQRLTYRDVNLRGLDIDSLGLLRYLNIDDHFEDSFSFHDMTHLVELNLTLLFGDPRWLESLMHVLHNSPKLKVLMIYYAYSHYFPLSWNQPSSVPECLSSHLEIFEWKAYEGRSEEKQLLEYILANSKCLKTVRISPRCFRDSTETILEKKKRIMEELESMYRASPSSQLILL